MNKKLAVIIRGPSGVGKSTIATLLHKKLPKSACIDIDLLKRMVSEESSPERTQIAHVVALSFAEQLMKNDYNIILDEIFRDEHYVKFQSLFARANYRLISIFLSAPLSVLIERDRKRTQKVKGEEIISRLYSEIVPRHDDVVIAMATSDNDVIVEKILKLVNL